MTKSYSIRIWSGLLSNGHTQKIENALWEFIWLVNKVTKEEDGIGYVLRGTPVKINDICNDLKRSYWGVYKHLQQLKKYKYINIKKAPYGIIVTINNSKKFIKNDKAGLAQQDKTEKDSLAPQVNSLAPQVNSLAQKDKANKIIKDIKDNNIYIEVFDYWNKKEIIVHKKLSAKAKTLIKSKVNEGYNKENIKDTIHNYWIILNGEEYYFKYRWTLEEFLQRGFEKFKDADIAHENYLREGKK